MIREIMSKACDLIFGGPLEPEWYVGKLRPQDALAAQLVVATERPEAVAETWHSLVAACGSPSIWNLFGAYTSAGELIGVMGFTQISAAKNLCVADIVVLAEWRCRGIGSALLQVAIDYAAATDRIITGAFRARDLVGLRWLANRGFRSMMDMDARPLIESDMFGDGNDGYLMARIDERFTVRIAQ